MNFIKSYSTISIYYGLITIINKLVGFITFPILIRYFSDDQYVLFEQILIIFLLANIIFSMEINSGFARYYHQSKKLNQLKKLFGNVYLLIFISAAILTVVCLALILFGIASEYRKFFPPLIVQFLFLNIFTIFQSILRFEEKHISFFFYNLIFYITQILLFLFSIYILNISLFGLFWILSFSYVLITLIGIIYFYKIFNFSFDKAYIKKIINYSYPAIFINLGNWANESLSRFLVSIYLSTTSFIILTTSLKIALIFKIISETYKKTLQSKLFYEAAFSVNYKKVSSHIINYSVISLVFFFLIQTISPILINYLVPKIYFDSKNYFPILFFSYYLLGLILFINGGNIRKKKIINNTYASLIGMCVNILLLVLFIKEFGILIFLIGSVIANLIQFILVYWTSKKHMELGIDFFNISFNIFIIFLNLVFFALANVYLTSILWLISNILIFLISILLMHFKYSINFKING